MLIGLEGYRFEGKGSLRIAPRKLLKSRNKDCKRVVVPRSSGRSAIPKPKPLTLLGGSWGLSNLVNNGDNWGNYLGSRNY